MASHKQLQPSLHLVSSPAQPVSTGPSSHTQSQSPFRFVQQQHPPRMNNLSEKDDTPLTEVSSSRYIAPAHSLPSSRTPSRSSTPAPSSSRNPAPSQFTTRRFSKTPRLSWSDRLKPWIPIILYVISSLGFVAAITFWKSEVFQGLDDLSHELQEDTHTGYTVLFFLIFITTFPPLPLYSTFIALSGYTFGPWIGAVISYFAALTGAIAVYLISRTFFRESITRWLSHTTTIKRVVHAIEKRPKLLFMVRLAPYPYNVMNALLAASPTLSFKTYTVCTALSLFKVIIHTSIGASIHSFAGYHLHDGEAQEDSPLGKMFAIVGIVLCVAIFIYLSWVARKAVDEELDADAPAEESRSFLANDEEDLESGMAESPFSSSTRGRR